MTLNDNSHDDNSLLYMVMLRQINFIFKWRSIYYITL